LETKLLGKSLAWCYSLAARDFAGGSKMRSFLSNLLRDEGGTTAIEYGLIAALISVVIIGAVTLVGSNLSNTFSFVASALSTAS
jgi:pilus assembly protein Flp/PilA